MNQDDQLSKSFKLSEMIRSDWANATHTSNYPAQAEVITNLENLCNGILQPLRDSIERPIVVNSGYRSPIVNKAVGGVATSAHLFGLAADITCPLYGDPVALGEYLVALLRKKKIKWDQIIYEHLGGAKWVHVGIRHPDGRQRGQVLTINSKGTMVGLIR